MSQKLEALSNGWGVQSSTLLMLSEEGQIDRFDAAFHGDPKNDGEEADEWKHKVRRKVSVPLIEVSAGDLRQDILDGLEKGTRFASIPTWCIGEDGDPAPIARQCTNDYKIQPVRQAIRKHLGYEPRSRVKHSVFLSIGFSIDEKSRMFDSETPWIRNEFPLIDLWWHRGQCVDYLAAKGLPNAPKSACTFCPYKTNSEWRRLRDNQPKEWIRVCEFDEKIRHQPKLNKPQFLHRSLRPLADADLTQDDQEQMQFFCGGGCGI